MKCTKWGSIKHPKAYLYIHIYIHTNRYAVVSRFGPKFGVRAWSNFSVFQKYSPFCRENEIFFKKKQDKTYHFLSTFGRILLRNILGPSFDSTFLTFSGQFFKNVETTIFKTFSARIAFFNPPPKN